MKKILSLLFCLSSPADVLFTYPASFQTDVPTNCTLTWTASDGAYTFRIGTSPGAYDIKYARPTNNSITLTLPASDHLYAHIYSSTSPGSDVVFSTTETVPDISLHVPTFTNDIDAALWATARVHEMRNIEGRPYPWSLLYQVTVPSHLPLTYCSDFSATLRVLLGQMGIGFSGHPALRQECAFRIGTRDTHTLVTVWNEQLGYWMLLDPMFGMTMRRAFDGQYATMQDMNASVISKCWPAITYISLCSDGFTLAHGVSLDYPLEWLNIPTMNYDTGEWLFGLTNKVDSYLGTNGVPNRYVF